MDARAVASGRYGRVAAAGARKEHDVGIYLNPGKYEYEEAIRSAIFVDKTEMIQYLNTVTRTKNKYVSVSRPRRFGKTMAADMICAYYGRTADSRSLFEKRKLAACPPLETEAREIRWDTYLGKFDVLRLVMTQPFKRNVSVNEGLEKLQKLVARDYREQYPDVDYYDETDLLQTMNDVYSTVGRQVVIVIDEWDALFRSRPEDHEGQRIYLDFLRDLMKDNRHIALAYMTGILPIKKYGQHSALNMFDEYSMMAPLQLAKYTGFTDEEVRELCGQYGRNYDEIKDWYDGYQVYGVSPAYLNQASQKTTGKAPAISRYALYGPLSVVNAMTTGRIRNYWNKTETYEALAEYIRMDYDGLRESVAILMDGGRLKIDTESYQNDMTTFSGRDDVLSLLVHLGYLGFDEETRQVFVPNREILDEFRVSTKSGEWIDTFRSFRNSLKLLKATWDEDEAAVAELLEEAHNKAGNKTFHDEAALSYSVQLAYYAAQKYYTTILELDTGKGYADIVYLPSPSYPDKPALLVELKYNQDVDTAISQIRRRQYPDRLEHYRGNILMVGIDYDRNVRSDDPEFKHHSCRIEHA